jgi:hypothetical protein
MERANSCPSFFELFKTAPGTRKQDPEQTEPGRLDRQGLKWGITRRRGRSKPAADVVESGRHALEVF